MVLFRRLFVMTLLMVSSINQSDFQIRACVSIPTTSTTTDLLKEDAVLETPESTTVAVTPPEVPTLTQLDQIMQPNTTIFNNTILPQSHQVTKKFISSKQPNLTFKDWKVDNKMEKLLGIERTVMPILVKKTAKENPKIALKDILLLFSDPSWKLKIAPAVSWTYCNPACGSGDQAIDLENAFENAHADVLSGINAALSSINLAPLHEHNIRLIYIPPNTLLEEFGNFTDKNDTKYRVKDKIVRYSIHQQGDITSIDDYSVKASISITSNYILNADLWDKILTTFTSFWRRERHVHFYSPPKMTSYKSANVSFSLLI